MTLRTAACSLLVAIVVAGCSPIARLAAGRPEWRKPGKTPTDYGLAGERVTFRSSDRLRVAGWWITSSEPRATVVLVHGIGGNKSDMLPVAQFLVAAHYDVLAIDLRAHGESQGTYPSPGYLEKAEVRAAARFAASRSKRPVILLGYSVGGVAVLHAAAAADPAVVAVIADSAFVSFFDMIRRVRKLRIADGAGTGERIGLWLAAAPTLSGLMRTVLWLSTGTDIDPHGGYLIPVVQRIHIPVLFLAGDHDPIAPATNAGNMRRLVPDGLGEITKLHASHRTYGDAPTVYRSAVLGFLERVLARPEAIAAGAR